MNLVPLDAAKVKIEEILGKIDVRYGISTGLKSINIGIYWTNIETVLARVEAKLEREGAQQVIEAAYQGTSDLSPEKKVSRLLTACVHPGFLNLDENNPHKFYIHVEKGEFRLGFKDLL